MNSVTVIRDASLDDLKDQSEVKNFWGKSVYVVIIN